MTAQAIDELICSQVFSKFFLKLDRFDNPAIARYLTDDARWERQGKLLRGRGEIVREMEARSRDLFVQHIAHQLVCEDVQPDRIKASAYMSVFRRPGPVTPPLPAQAPDMLFIWSVEFARSADTWRIDRLAAKPLYRD